MIIINSKIINLNKVKVKVKYNSYSIIINKIIRIKVKNLMINMDKNPLLTYRKLIFDQLTNLKLLLFIGEILNCLPFQINSSLIINIKITLIKKIFQPNNTNNVNQQGIRIKSKHFRKCFLYNNYYHRVKIDEYVLKPN